MVGGAGFEPTKAEPTDLQSAPVDRFGIPPELHFKNFKDRGDSFKKITLCSEKKIWGLKPSVTRSMGRPGLILAGDSNHSIHPLEGMGFNLALSDIAVICDCLSSARKNVLSFSHPSILSEYRARRRLEVEAIIALTQGLNRLFSYNSFKFKTFPSSLTNIGLGIMDSLPIKKQLAKIAAGGVLPSASLFSDV